MLFRSCPNIGSKLETLAFRNVFLTTRHISTRLTGTPHYLAPEISNAFELDDDSSDDEEIQSYTNAVDVWSFACVIYQLLSLQVPFPKRRDLLRFCRGGKFPATPLLNRTSDAGVNFVKSVLVPDPALRPSAKESLQSEWLRVESRVQNEVFDLKRSLKPDLHKVAELTLPSELVVTDKGINVEGEILSEYYHELMGVASPRFSPDLKSEGQKPEVSSRGSLVNTSNLLLDDSNVSTVLGSPKEREIVKPTGSSLQRPNSKPPDFDYLDSHLQFLTPRQRSHLIQRMM
jgi:serine/threonine protein kinase